MTSREEISDMMTKEKIENMHDYQTVVSETKTWTTDVKFITSSSPYSEITLHESARLLITWTWVDEKWIIGCKIVKYTKKRGEPLEEKESVTFSQTQANFVAWFLDFLQSQDIWSLPKWNFKWKIDFSHISDDQLDSLKKLISEWKVVDHKLVQSIIENGITDKDAVAMWYRKKQLEIFDKLLNDVWFIDEYKTNKSITWAKEETVFQHFFQKNQRIFGYGLDYRFLEIIQKESTVAPSNIWWREQEFLDFLLWTRDFTVLVEIKKPSTNLFWSWQNRSWSRSLSDKFIDAVWQILEYKASAQLFLENPNNCTNSDWNYFFQKTFDPKSILIMWRNRDFEWKNDLETKTKKRTFELFRRDSRNIDIVTFDELYERAYFIVHNELPNKSISSTT